MPIATHDYCRQPEIGASKAWCYVEGGYQHCDIPECEKVAEPEPGSESSHCQDLSLDHKGLNYMGKTSKTVSGETCKDWSKVSN